MANKVQRSVRLSAVIWAQVDDLIGMYGDGDGEVMAHVLNDWFSGNQDEISSRRALVKRLKPKIDAIQAEADKKASKRKLKSQ